MNEGMNRIFISEPIIQTKNQGREYVLHEPFIFYYKGNIVIIPGGFESDWASVPRVLWRIFPPHFYNKSSLVHDFLYASEYDTRKNCDDFFRECLKEEGASLIKRNLMWAGVRVGGGIVWARHDLRDVNTLRRSIGLRPILRDFDNEG